MSGHIWASFITEYPPLIEFKSELNDAVTCRINGDKLHGLDPKPSDLAMSRLKVG